MAEPVLVVHGVANRDQSQFEAQVRALNDRVGREFNFIPVYWGNLGANVRDIAATLPRIEGIVPGLIDDLLHGPSGAVAVRSGPDNLKEIVIETAQRALASGQTGVRSAEPAQSQDIEDAITEIWDSTNVLQRITDENTLRSVGTAVGIVAQRLAEDQIATNAQVRGAFADLKEFVKNTLGAIDDVIASALGNVAGVFNQYLRERLSPGIGYFLGDVFVYQRHREQIRETLTTALAEHAPGLGADPKTSVSLIAHSLGGVVSFDAAVSDSRPLWIKNFITFGSQSPFFHVLDRRSNTLAAYAGAPVVLPPTIQQWTNLWEPMDPLAFVASKIFIMAGGRSPSDVEVQHTSDAGLWTHSAYWTNAKVADQIRSALST
jgi:hypothetical protein